MAAARARCPGCRVRSNLLARHRPGDELGLANRQATIVRVGFSAPPVVNWLPSAVKRFLMSCVWPCLLTTPSLALALIRAGPEIACRRIRRGVEDACGADRAAERVALLADVRASLS